LRVSLPSETGEGGKPPSPSAPPPEAIPTTVHCPGEPGINQVRAILPPAAPEHGFPPDISTHCPRPAGAGEERAAREGWGYEYRSLVRQGRGASPRPVGPSPRCDIRHGPLYWGESGKGWFYACSLSHGLMSVSYKKWIESARGGGHSRGAALICSSAAAVVSRP